MEGGGATSNGAAKSVGPETGGRVEGGKIANPDGERWCRGIGAQAPAREAVSRFEVCSALRKRASLVGI